MAKKSLNKTEYQSVMPEIIGYKKEHKEKKWLYNIVTVLASLVVFVTTYALILPAITMDADEGAVCGYISHRHSSSCFDENGNLICELPEHEHDMGCFVTPIIDSPYVCGYDYEHVHDAFCYRDGYLVCSLKEHIHNINTCVNLRYLTHVVYAKAEDGAVIQVGGLLPENCYVKVNMPDYSSKELKNNLGENVSEMVGGSFVTYDISLFVGGQEYQPLRPVNVRVIHPAPKLKIKDSSSIGVLHVSEGTNANGKVSVQDLSCYTEDGLVSFTTTSFSEFIFYQVAVSANENLWTFDGGTETSPAEKTMAEIFTALGYTAHTAAQITDVTVTDPGENELQAYNDNGTWKIKAVNAFYTRETITVTFSDNSTFKIVASGIAKREERPDYGTYKDTSLSKSHTDDIDAAIRPTAEGSSSMEAYSDSSTSKIESKFTGQGEFGSDPSLDGLTVVDKSVIYGANDYYTWSSYAQDEFSVTLSALAQQYEDGTIVADTVPVDVVFILDVSGSMNSTAAGASQTRREQATIALNTLFNDIMALHDGNRVSLVTFGSSPDDLSDSWVQNQGNSAVPVKTLLPLGRYYQGSDTTYSNGSGGRKLGYDRNSGYTFFNQAATSGAGTISINSNVYQYDYRDFNYATNEDGPFDGWKAGATKTLKSGSSTVTMGTFTQGGIQQGANEFLNTGDDVTWTSPVTGKVYTRVPVFILISDGAPTLTTADYQNPNGNIRNIRGFGSEQNNINLGAAGYYTILTANYFKDKVSKHYGVPASFYSIGMGINKTGQTAAVTSNDYSGDHYKRAVLNPTAANINALLENITSNNNKLHSGVLYSLLNNRTVYPNANGTFGTTSFLYTPGTGSPYEMNSANTGTVRLNNSGKSYVDVGINTSYSILKETVNSQTINRRYVSVINNPYSDYAYADAGYFDSNWDPGIMSQLILTEVESNIKSYHYTQSVRSSSTSIRIVDQIGEGMEIKKTDGLVLYFTDDTYPTTSTEGKCYTLTYDSDEDVWAYTGNAVVYPNYYSAGVPLSGIDTSAGFERIEVAISEDSNGMQTLTWTIPNAYLPEYTHATIGSWYYEALPVRLMYKVGLNDDAKETVKNLRNDTIEFYTNVTSNGSVATIIPNLDSANENPYYTDPNYQDTTEAKTNNGTHSGSGTGTANQTGTMTNAYKTTRNGTSENYTVTAVLGNNGKLVYKQAEKTPDPTKGTTSLTARKDWKNASGTALTGSNIPESSVTVRLLADGVPYANSERTLNSSNSWKTTWTNLPVKYDDDTDITWTVDETKVSDSTDKIIEYDVTYSDGGEWTSLTGNNQTIKDGMIYYFRQSGSGNNNYSFKADMTRSSSVSNPSSASLDDMEDYLWVGVSVTGGVALVPYSDYISSSTTNRVLRLNRSGGGGNATYSFQVTSSNLNNSAVTLTKSNNNNTYAIRMTNNQNRYVQMPGSTGTISPTSNNATYFTVYEYQPVKVVTNKVLNKYSVTVTKSVPNLSGTWSFAFTASYEKDGVTVSLGNFNLTNTASSKVLANIPEGAKVTVKETLTSGYLTLINGTETTDGKYTTPGTSGITANTTVAFTNKPISELPETGGSGTKPIFVAGASMISVSLVAMYIFIKRNRRNGNEEI